MRLTRSSSVSYMFIRSRTLWASDEGVSDIIETQVPAGPWVLVVGMHRSGTSAVAGALGQLGLSLPAGADAMTGRYDNPIHHESRALVDFDDTLLRELGGSWSAPPTLEPGWETSPVASAMTQRARRATRTAFPAAGPLVWKDPRLCILLPFWRSILPAPVGAVFLWRAPLAVARSLRTRQDFTVSHGLALWDRYTRDALLSLAGMDVLVVEFEELLRDAEGAVKTVASWLSHVGRPPIGAKPERLAAAVSSISLPMARHDGDGELPEVLRETVETLKNLKGPHDQFRRVDLPRPPAWMADAIRQRRDYEVIYAKYLRYAKWRRRIPLRGGARGFGGPRSVER
jgi:hypothetical protein